MWDAIYRGHRDQRVIVGEQTQGSTGQLEVRRTVVEAVRPLLDLDVWSDGAESEESVEDPGGVVNDMGQGIDEFVECPKWASETCCK